MSFHALPEASAIQTSASWKRSKAQQNAVWLCWNLTHLFVFLIHIYIYLCVCVWYLWMGLNDKECGTLHLSELTQHWSTCAVACYVQCLLWVTPPRLPCSACEQSCQCWYIGESCIQLLVKDGLGTVSCLHVESKTSNLATWEMKFKWMIGIVWHCSPHCTNFQTIPVCSIQLPACSKSRKSEAVHFPGTLPSDGSGSNPPCIPSPQWSKGMLSQLLIKPSGHYHVFFISIWPLATPEINVKCFTQAAPRVKGSYDFGGVHEASRTVRLLNRQPVRKQPCWLAGKALWINSNPWAKLLPKLIAEKFDIFLIFPWKTTSSLVVRSIRSYLISKRRIFAAPAAPHQNP